MLPIFALLLSLAPGADAPAGSYPTYRGNAARTGSDNSAGPTDSFKVLWMLKSADQFVAAPVPVGKGVYLAGLGAFNRPSVAVYPWSNPANAEPKPLWSRSAPYLRLASVSAPAVGEGLVVFGDGLHQDAGGTLHALHAETGRPVWQLALPGDLIHLEGTPTLADDTVWMGAGAGGVLAVSLKTAMLDGAELTVEKILAKQEARWKELEAKYAADKAKDPTFAIPPDEDQLYKPAPKLRWQKGQG
ncbi:MAG: PQQ-binding-like beta-propeller repeat protein, partial [Gemmataceae bacterium]